MNRQLTISTGESRASKNWRPESLSWQDFCERLRTSRPLSCTYNDYLRLNKPQQDALKDVGGFMGRHSKRPTAQGRCRDWPRSGDA